MHFGSFSCPQGLHCRATLGAGLYAADQGAKQRCQPNRVIRVHVCNEDSFNPGDLQV